MSNKLKTYIKDHNLTINDVATILGVCPNYASRIINKNTNLNFDLSSRKINLLIRYLNCKPEDILDDLQLYIYQNNIYPKNLINAIHSMNRIESDDLEYIVNEFDKNLQLIYKELPNVFSEKEKLVIEYRFKEGYTLNECGNLCNLTRERIRQIEYNILVKLNKNEDIKYILTYGEELWHMNCKIRELEKEELKLKEKALMEHIAAVSNEKFNYLLKSNDELLYYNIDILKFSLRTYNCLKRAGIHSIQDLILVTPKTLKDITSLGKKSIEEIINKLNEYNIKLKYEDKIKYEFKIK